MKRKILLIIVFSISTSYLFADTSGDKDISTAQTWISFLPVIFFLLILMITTFKLKNDHIKLSDLLTEKDPVIPAAVGAPAVAPVPGVPVATSPSSQSVSRFIAFLTGLVALSIGICITTFYMYSYFSNPTAKIDFSNLTNVIWGLGIGVLPYGFNKASAALKPTS
ncbi:MAG: hypothetical protein JWQ84_2275 [Mucilaginibacter sp.]|nr:hypothetical protein [Mucilaginibacter sp.]